MLFNSEQFFVFFPAVLIVYFVIPEKVKLSPEAIEILDGITDTCKDKGIDLVIFTIPWQGEFNYHHALEKYSKKRDANI